ncbi:hypothetical protein ASG40_18185 [Methylobacterium sp. Leaf399]|uniref:FkbM family methyltransferase n=1 Tax=Methylobacterium sp. Leaf399 TaxID=1736364 RepID=UPI00070155AA|nr:FkbM family methyltransferase [Methylobacterium sp. Leaf399]KQT16169.1 hypothetical protein ASG40_18185 [Methylobacterium sp. Leaf399]
MNETSTLGAPIVSTRIGDMVLPDIETDIIGRHVDRYGEWAWNEVLFVADQIGAGGRVLDAGAFVGTFGLGLASLKPVEFLCFIEANGQVSPRLRTNVETLRQADDAIVEAILTDGSQEAAPTGLSESGNLGSTSYAQGATGDVVASEALRTVTLAQIRALYGPFDLIKLDVEGLEADVLRADEDFVRSGQSAIWLECNESIASLQLADMLLSWNLPVHYFAFPAFNPDNFRGAAEAIFPMAYESGLLVSPRNPPVLSPALVRAECILKPVTSVEDLKRAMWLTPRWCLPSWERAPRPELVALAAHEICCDVYDRYLEAGWTRGEFLLTRTERAEHAFIEADAELLRHKNEIVALRDDLAQARAELALLRLEMEAAPVVATPAVPPNAL